VGLHALAQQQDEMVLAAEVQRQFAVARKRQPTQKQGQGQVREQAQTQRGLMREWSAAVQREDDEQPKRGAEEQTWVAVEHPGQRSPAQKTPKTTAPKTTPNPGPKAAQKAAQKEPWKRAVGA
jgi:hypothetical protein